MHPHLLYGSRLPCAVSFKVIQLTVDQFSFCNGNDVPNIYDGINASAPLIGTLSVNPKALLRSFMSSQSYLFVLFTSNNGMGCQGFTATYRLTTPGTSHTHTRTCAHRLGSRNRWDTKQDLLTCYTWSKLAKGKQKIRIKLWGIITFLQWYVGDQNSEAVSI